MPFLTTLHAVSKILYSPLLFSSLLLAKFLGNLIKICPIEQQKSLRLPLIIFEDSPRLHREIDRNSAEILEDIKKSKDSALQRKKSLEDEEEHFRKAAFAALNMLNIDLDWSFKVCLFRTIFTWLVNFKLKCFCVCTSQGIDAYHPVHQPVPFLLSTHWKY